MNTNLENLVDATIDDSKVDLAGVWNAIDSPIYRVIDEDGVNVAGGQCRRLDNVLWLYVDDQDGYSIINEEEVARLLTVFDEKHVAYGWDKTGEVVRM